MKLVVTIFTVIYKMVIKMIRRLYNPLIREHFKKNRQMLFLMGPRQVGKTTLCLSLRDYLNSDFTYLNWDNLDDRAVLMKGPSAIAQYAHLRKARETPPLLVLDEIHKFKEWKTLLKGFFDTYAHAGEVRIVITGSARLDIYKAGGDSLMGRYFPFRIHPLSVGELLHDLPPTNLFRKPSIIDRTLFQTLYQFGGFPEPFLKADPTFYENWRRLRTQQFFYEDVRDLTNIQEIQQMELLALNLKNNCGSLTNYTSLSSKVRVSNETIRRWIETLKLLYYCFPLHPWSKNIPRSLLKEPKFYLWDWSQIDDPGKRAENFIASHLLKACHYWTDRGLGFFQLHFLRDKEKREIDFIVTKNNHPWFIAEVKLSSSSLNANLKRFQKLTGAEHAFQIVLEAEFEKVDCFSYQKPIIVPAQTFLSQLI